MLATKYGVRALALVCDTLHRLVSRVIVPTVEDLGTPIQKSAIGKASRISMTALHNFHFTINRAMASVAGLGVPPGILRTHELQPSPFLTSGLSFTLNDRFDDIAINMDISERLAKLERRATKNSFQMYKIGRVFQDKLTAIKAINSDGRPAHYREILHMVRRNDELAVIGDKAIDLVLDLMWYRAQDTRGL